MIVQNARRGTKCVGSFDPMSQRGQNSGTIMITIVHLAMQYGAVGVCVVRQCAFMEWSQRICLFHVCTCHVVRQETTSIHEILVRSLHIVPMGHDDRG